MLIKLGESIVAYDSNIDCIAVDVLKVGNKKLRFGRLVDKHGKNTCRHLFMESELVNYLKTKDGIDSICPMCNDNRKIRAGDEDERRKRRRDEPEDRGKEEESESESDSESESEEEYEEDNSYQRWTVRDEDYYTDGKVKVSQGVINNLITFCGKDLDLYGRQSFESLDKFNKKVRLVIAYRQTSRAAKRVDEIAGFVLYRHNVTEGGKDLKGFIRGSMLKANMYIGTYESSSFWLDGCVKVIKLRNEENKGPFNDINDVPKDLMNTCRGILGSISPSEDNSKLVRRYKEYVDFLMVLDEGTKISSEFPVVVPSQDEAHAYVILECSNPTIGSVGVASHLLKHVETRLLEMADSQEDTYTTCRMSLIARSQYSENLYASLGFIHYGKDGASNMITGNLREEKNRLIISDVNGSGKKKKSN
jgi:hypothetical protein